MIEAGVIRRFTAEVAAAVADAHDRDPIGELLVWLQMALRREASVGEIYGAGNLELRLASVQGARKVVAFLRTTVANVWAQEKAHAAYLEAVLGAVARPSALRLRLGARLDGFLGAMEGQVLSGRTSPSPLRRAQAALMLIVGRRVQDVPGFVAALSALTFREFCLLNAELEVTAVHGYERMLTLLQAGEARARLGDDTTLIVDIKRMIADERFHHEAFVAMAEWFEEPAGDALRRGVSVEVCAARMSLIRAQVYGGS